MKFERKDMLDLNEENVKKVFNYCLANKETKDPFKAEFLKETLNMKLPNIFFSRQKVTEKYQAIKYLIGQLLSVHKDDSHLSLMDGYKKYDSTNWTENKGSLFMLYYLGTSIAALPLFKPFHVEKTYMSSIHGQTLIKPTLSPVDPAFPDWLKKNGLEQA